MAKIKNKTGSSYICKNYQRKVMPKSLSTCGRQVSERIQANNDKLSKVRRPIISRNTGHNNVRRPSFTLSGTRNLGWGWKLSSL